MSLTRIEPGERSTAAVIFGDLVFLSGQVSATGATVAEQTTAILSRIDQLLAQAQSDRTLILQAIIWLSDMAAFDEMNEAWKAWIPPGCAPARATSGAVLAGSEYLVEITVTAARIRRD